MFCVLDNDNDNDDDNDGDNDAAAAAADDDDDTSVIISKPLFLSAVFGEFRGGNRTSWCLSGRGRGICDQWTSIIPHYIQFSRYSIETWERLAEIILIRVTYLREVPALYWLTCKRF